MIPAEAIGAAHKAWREQAALDGSIFEYNLRAALEAAAPHMLAEGALDGWDEGYVIGYQDRGRESQGAAHRANPYRPTP